MSQPLNTPENPGAEPLDILEQPLTYRSPLSRVGRWAAILYIKRRKATAIVGATAFAAVAFWGAPQIVDRLSKSGIASMPVILAQPSETEEPALSNADAGPIETTQPKLQAEVPPVRSARPDAADNIAEPESDMRASDPVMPAPSQSESGPSIIDRYGVDVEAGARGPRPDPAPSSDPDVRTSQIEAVSERVEELAARREQLETLVGENRILQQTFTVSIIDEPGSKAGFWRMKDGREETRQHFLVVETTTEDGTPYPIEIEDMDLERSVRTAVFAIEVSEGVFDTFAADKADDGVIADPIVGTKRHGAAQIEWQVDTTGRKITEWQ